MLTISYLLVAPRRNTECWAPIPRSACRAPVGWALLSTKFTHIHYLQYSVKFRHIYLHKLRWLRNGSCCALFACTLMYNQFKTSINRIKVHLNIRNVNIIQLINLSFLFRLPGCERIQMNHINTKYALILIRYSNVI